MDAIMLAGSSLIGYWLFAIEWEHSTFNIQHSTFNAQCRKSPRCGDEVGTLRLRRPRPRSAGGTLANHDDLRSRCAATTRRRPAQARCPYLMLPIHSVTPSNNSLITSKSVRPL